MKKINFNVTIKDLDGNDVTYNNEPMVVKNLVSNSLLSLQKQDNPIKILDLSLRIYKSTDAVELDDSDVTLIENTIKQSDSPVIIVAQILKLLQGN